MQEWDGWTDGLEGKVRGGGGGSGQGGKVCAVGLARWWVFEETRRKRWLLAGLDVVF